MIVTGQPHYGSAALGVAGPPLWLQQDGQARVRGVRVYTPQKVLVFDAGVTQFSELAFAVRAVEPRFDGLLTAVAPGCFQGRGRSHHHLVIAAGYVLLATNPGVVPEDNLQVIVNHRVYWLDVTWNGAGPVVTIADAARSNETFLDTPTDVHFVGSM